MDAISIRRYSQELIHATDLAASVVLDTDPAILTHHSPQQGCEDTLCEAASDMVPRPGERAGCPGTHLLPVPPAPPARPQLRK